MSKPRVRSSLETVTSEKEGVRKRGRPPRFNSEIASALLRFLDADRLSLRRRRDILLRQHALQTLVNYDPTAFPFCAPMARLRAGEVELRSKTLVELGKIKDPALTIGLALTLELFASDDPKYRDADGAKFIRVNARAAAAEDAEGER